MIDLVVRLRNWERVYPCDKEKPDGSLYLEAADRITELEAKLDRVRGLPEKWREDEDACAAWEQWRNGAHCADELQSALGDEASE